VAVFFAEELTAPEFAGFVTTQTVGVLPVGATSPHGPHLPLSTDCDIMRGHLAQIGEYIGETAEMIILPMQTIGLSVEHAAFAGAFSHSPETLLKVWADIARVFHAAGGRRLIVISTHDGNAEVAGLLATGLRLDPGMLAVSAAWSRFGQPEGLFAPAELAYGIHGGDIETSLMLHYWPEAVRIDERRDFASAATTWDKSSQVLSAHGKTRFGWLSHDLNPIGAVGDASAATAAKGAASADHALRGFAALVGDVAAFDLSRLEGVR